MACIPEGGSGGVDDVRMSALIKLTGSESVCNSGGKQAKKPDSYDSDRDGYAYLPECCVCGCSGKSSKRTQLLLRLPDAIQLHGTGEERYVHEQKWFTICHGCSIKLYDIIITE
jgi:hypothetical protein